MNLIIDIGNSFVKLAVFDGDHIKHKEVVELNLILERIRAIDYTYKHIKAAIVSSVGKLSKTDINLIGERFDLLILNSDTKLPYASLYKTPETLGVDRIALVSASVKNYPGNNVLIIDAGTCITYDFVNNKNEYLGGAISPGLRMRYTSLNNLTANLPLLDTELPNNIIGNSTEASIHSGVVYGVLKEIDGVIEAYKANYPDLTVILTGGDSNFLSKQLKSSIFATPNFLLEGLNFILQFNSNE
ncbi:Type III pantothenate kinase [Mariniflexile rhizosphaerae]|uniref:type III pantothenate kinase n=1 Tax=unclassified Mariniflexile TaxID=2643887 RepID=UPI000CB1CE49|nr:type III pantothenate kinase [Mariniflexile sp. TRM1-10]AXP81347.1 Type III pantothenate kinase [Mariniflexile sp. TRM1-10]PLB17568.1 MAG: Pantothenate kinase type III [Flavobacteriaceae bacterium FS1-H7996/R]